MTIYTNQALFKGVNKRAQVVPNLYTNQTSLKGEKKEAWDVPKLSADICFISRRHHCLNFIVAVFLSFADTDHLPIRR